MTSPIGVVAEAAANWPDAASNTSVPESLPIKALARMTLPSNIRLDGSPTMTDCARAGRSRGEVSRPLPTRVFSVRRVVALAAAVTARSVSVWLLSTAEKRSLPALAR